MRSVPAVTGETQPIIRIVELLPAPFGPRKPNASPCWTSRSIPSTATSSPKRLTSPRAWIMAPFSLTASTYLRRSGRLSGRLDVAGDLIDRAPARSRRPARRAAAPTARRRAAGRRGRPRSRAGTARSGAPRRRSADSCRSRSPPDGRAPRRRRSRSAGTSSAGSTAQVRGRVAERAAALVAARRRSRRAPAGARAAARPPATSPSCSERADLGRRDTLEQRHGPHLEAEPLEQLEVAAAPAPEAEVLARDDHAPRPRAAPRRTPPAPSSPRRA